MSELQVSDLASDDEDLMVSEPSDEEEGESESDYEERLSTTEEETTDEEEGGEPKDKGEKKPKEEKKKSPPKDDKEKKKKKKKRSKKDANAIVDSTKHKRVYSKAVHEGWLTKEGKKVKNWKRRYFRLFQKTAHLKYYKSKQSQSPKGVVELRNVEVRKIEYKKKPFVFCISHIGKKDRTFFISAPSELERKGWIEAVLKYRVEGDVKKTKYSEEQQKKIGMKVDDILTEFSCKKKIKKAINSLSQLYRKYPHCQRVILVLADFYSMRGEKKVSIDLLENQLHKNLSEEKIKTMADEEVQEQYKFHFEIGNLCQDLYEKKKAKKYLERCVFYYEACMLLLPEQCEAINNLAIVFDKLGKPAKSNVLWARMIELDPPRRKFHYVDYVNSLRVLQNETKIFWTLTKAAERDTQIGYVYRELSNLLTLKKLKKDFLRIAEFYDFVGDYVSETGLKFSVPRYELMKKVVKNGSKAKNLEKIMRPLFDDKSLECSELLISFLHYIDEQQGNKPNKSFQDLIGVIISEIGERIQYGGEEIMNSFYKCYLKAINFFMFYEISCTMFEHSKTLKKNGLYDTAIEVLIKAFVKTQNDKLLPIFEMLQEPKFIPYLFTASTFSKNKTLRKKCCFSLAKYVGISKETKKMIKQRLFKLYNHPKMKTGMRLATAATLYRITKKETILRKAFNGIKKKEVPSDVVSYISKTKGSGDLVVQFNGSGSTCKTM